MVKKYRKLTKGEFITVGVDTAIGGNDYTSAQFVSKTRNDVPMVYCSRNTTVDLTNQLPSVLEGIYDVTGIKPLVAYERNNGGVFELERLASMNRNGKYSIFEMPTYGSVDNAEPHKIGWDTNTATRQKMLQDLKDIIDHRILEIYDEDTVKEMFSFVIVQGSTTWKAQAEVGAHDDRIMALAIACQLYLYSKAPNIERIIDVSDFPKNDLFDKDGFY